MSGRRALRGTATAVVAGVAVAVVRFWWQGRSEREAAASAGSANAPAHPPTTAAGPGSSAAATGAATAASRGRTPDEKAAWIARINRDYDEMRKKGVAEFGAAGAGFPGGVQAFLRHLQLLEEERRADLLEVLTPEELEQLEWRETAAGQSVRSRLGNSAATAEQRLAAFRLQREFDREFGLTLDLSPAALLQRERARQATEQKLQGVLGEELFTAWTRADTPDFERFRAFAVQQALPLDTPRKLWAAKNEYTLQRLEIAARNDLMPEQRAEAQRLLVAQTEARLRELLGPVAMPRAEGEILQWLRGTRN